MNKFLALLLLTLPLSAQTINGVTGQTVSGVTSSPAYVAGGGSANSQTATFSPAVASWTAGLQLCWLPVAANTTTAPTFSPNGLAAKTITKYGTTALAASDLTTTAIACGTYDGTQLQLQNPQTVTGGGGSSGGLFGGLTVPTLASTGLSSQYGGSATYSATNGTYGIALVDTAAANKVGGQVKAYPGVAYTVTALFSAPSKLVNWQEFGLIIADTLSGKCMAFKSTVSASPPMEIGVRAWTNPTTFSSDPLGDTGILQSPYIWLRLKDDGTNITFYSSTDGTIFNQLYTVAKSSSFLGASGFNYLGAEITPNATATGSTLMSWTITTP